MTFETVKIDNVEGGVRVIKISRPQALNALNSVALSELKKVFGDASEDPTVRVVLFTGDGDQSFIAGADILEMKDKKSGEGVTFAQLGHEVTKLLELMTKPTIAAVNGYALGGGTEFATACDFIVASETAVFGQPEVGLGVIPGFGGTIRLAKFVGMPRAKELIFSGRKVKAQEALQIGLVNHVLPKEGFLEAAIKIAQQISCNSVTAVSSAKKLLNEFSESVGLDSKLDAEAHEFGNLFGSHDQKEGMGAFVEKRKPKFEGLLT